MQTLPDGTRVESVKVDGHNVIVDGKTMTIAQFHARGGILALHHDHSRYKRGAFWFFKHVRGSRIDEKERKAAEAAFLAEDTKQELEASRLAAQAEAAQIS